MGIADNGASVWEQMRLARVVRGETLVPGLSLLCEIYKMGSVIYEILANEIGLWIDRVIKSHEHSEGETWMSNEHYLGFVG
jgi:hypothetical protein